MLSKTNKHKQWFPQTVLKLWSCSVIYFSATAEGFLVNVRPGNTVSFPFDSKDMFPHAYEQFRQWIKSNGKVK